MAELPAAEVQNPSCGACQMPTEFDGDVFACEGCGLDFDRDDLTATFRDPEAPTCAAACDNYWHGPERINKGIAYECTTCPLPEGHSSLHLHPCRPFKITDHDASGARGITEGA